MKTKTNRFKRLFSVDCISKENRGFVIQSLISSSRRKHILEGESLPSGRHSGGHGAGTGFPGKTEFPATWTDDEIIDYVTDVALDPSPSRKVQSGGDVIVTGTRQGIEIRVVIRNKEIWAAYPFNVKVSP